MTRLQFRAEAIADLRQIAQATKAQWGVDQSARYVAALRDSIKSLPKFPLRFPDFEPRPRLRRMNSGRHAVFYLVEDNRLEIIRVLHVASDIERLV